MGKQWKTTQGPGAPAEVSVLWTLEQQWLIDGALDINLWVTIIGETKRSSTVWAGVTVTAGQMDDPVMVVALSEVEHHVVLQEYRQAKDMLDLIATM